MRLRVTGLFINQNKASQKALKSSQTSISIFNKMKTLLVFIAVCFLSMISPTWSRATPTNKAASTPEYQTEYFDQPIDHFDFVRGAKTFKQRYLISGKEITCVVGNLNIKPERCDILSDQTECYSESQIII